MAQYQATPPPYAAVDPGKTMGIIGLVLAFLCSIAGLIVSLLAYNKSKAAGYKNTIALVGIVLSIIFMVTGGIYGGVNYSRMN